MEGRLYGLGISNMKGALACYVEARARAGGCGREPPRRLLIAAVCGEIEKTQYGDAQGAQYRGYAAGLAYLVSTAASPTCASWASPPRARSCSATSDRSGSASACRATSSTPRSARASATKLDPQVAGRLGRDPRVDPQLGGRSLERLPRRQGARERGRDRGRLWLARLAHAASHRPLPRRPRAADEADGRRPHAGARHGARAERRFPAYGIEGEVYVTAPGAEIAEDHELVHAVDEAHQEAYGEAPGRDVTRWFSDASALVALRRPDAELRNVHRAHGCRARARTSRSRASSRPRASMRGSR